MIKGLFSNTLFSEGWLKVWSIYLLLFPFYIFPAGSAQPSDIFVAICIGAYLIGGKFQLSDESTSVFKKFLIFCGYVTVINLGAHISLLGELNRGLPWYVFSAFYVYNLLVMGFSLSLYKKYRVKFLYTTVYSCILSGVLQIAFSFVFETSGEGIRGALFFTNPNQLGYYSLCALAIVLVLESRIKISKILVYASFFIFGYMALISVSKAALGALLILAAAYLIANKVISLRNLAAVVVVGGMGFLAITRTDFGKQFQANWEKRELNDAGRSDEITEWEYRGYDRISNHPGYLVLGAGEGGYNRFDTYIDNHEMHSSFGTIVFCYGIPGTILFVIFVFALLKKLPWVYLIYALPLFSYGLTHMGLRFTIFWVALMMFPIIKMEVKRQKVLIIKRKIEARKNNNRTSVSQIPVEGAA